MTAPAKNSADRLAQLGLELGAVLKDAHEKAELGSVRSVAAALDISHATLARLRNGDIAAAGPVTLQRVLDYYGVEAPHGLDLSVEAKRGGSKVRYVFAYCVSPHCPACLVSLTGGEWILRPQTLSVPEVLFARSEGGICRECRSRLRRTCSDPSCGASFEKGAFCPFCGRPYVSTDGLDEDTLQELRRRSERGNDYLDRVDRYQALGRAKC